MVIVLELIRYDDIQFILLVVLCTGVTVAGEDSDCL